MFLLLGQVGKAGSGHYKQDLLLHDYRIAGYLANGLNEIQIIRSFTAANCDDLKAGQELLAANYSAASKSTASCSRTLSPQVFVEPAVAFCLVFSGGCCTAVVLFTPTLPED